ncbi:hypothetical protein BDZ90DRAFT_234424 [Jaminaea rosea]|uniref:Kinetochore protein Spc24 n=1 Tax=Jaminaea rosea TaxID=1569628 RepID=A0A316UQ14_9BASI|nr:hypothetical protein BDZ90DRAFT_234424 [Jaminaea rosea]PWN25225.1 hypothetical protein BDZ90DRAFT_234424 [Jaminaea rosea]
MDPTSDIEAWLQVLEAVQDQSRERQMQRRRWANKLDALQSNLATLRATQPRSSWRSPNAHSQHLAAYGQRTLELAKQIAKLEAAISRTETDVRECKAELERLDRGDDAAGVDDGEGEDDEEGEAWGEKALGRHTLALTMFRQLGFQPLLSSSSSSSSAPDAISTLFARSDAKGKVTPFKVGEKGGAAGSRGWAEMSDAERATMVNAMWDAVE